LSEIPSYNINIEMGKSQYKKKTAQRRHNPIRVPDSHLGGGKGDGKADPAKEKQMLPVLNKVCIRKWTYDSCYFILLPLFLLLSTKRMIDGRS